MEANVVPISTLEHGGDPEPEPRSAYDRLLGAIEAGELPPGARLREAELAQRFGVSRTPVREALKRLEAQGLVAHTPHKGVAVAVLDYRRLGELYAFRELVEGAAARMAARHASPVEIVVLEDMVASDRAIAERPAALARANRRFHRQLHLAANNRYLLDSLATMRLSLALLTGTTLAEPGRGPMSVDEHAAIVRAIAERDDDAAEAAARAHIRSAYEARLRAMAQGRDGESAGDGLAGPAA